ncbi:MAG: hypothetical protein SPF41_06490 [Candidatus Merdousia sp.]|nr:hypothetical protein [Candidatus Merdousia sp.]
MKKYAEFFEKVFYFAEYGDYANYFIQLGYVCDEWDFVSRVGEPLRNITAQNGRQIFKTPDIDFDKYTLLSETIEKPANGVLSVKELYGFAPSTTYTRYTAEPIQVFGLSDPSGFYTTTINTTGAPNEYDVVLDRFTLHLADAGSLNVGDLVECSLKGVGTFYDAYSPSVPIISKSGNVITTPAFSITFLPPEGSGMIESKQDTINILNALNPLYWNGVRNLLRRAATRKPRMEITNLRNEIAFFQSPPPLDMRFAVSLGNDETDTITAETTPSVDVWKQRIANGEYYNAQDSEIEVVFPNALYKRTTKRAACR